MADNWNNGGPVREAERKSKRQGGSQGVPGFDIRQLIEERNWPALAGLALIGIGILYLVQNVLGLDFNIWSLALLGIGGWLMWDGWQSYEAHGRVWVENSRNRMTGGAVIALIGLFAILDLSGWGFFLVLVGGYLAWNAWRNYEQNGRVWNPRDRNRMWAGAIMVGIGVFGLINLWSTWPLLLIVVGAVVLYRQFGNR
ncbi:MAG: hypothetical protein GXY36_01480 [Chloroflexi bacterium]|nr:hypothetical protein [Chloroflexota bacterium]